ncbi:MAG TPA: TlpA disulfide reductase family protein [Bryobacteraceae bacterium]|jgi:thiol-disulfide isomerase/thioredoxin|nr:TlpA disulfide reductase family protein [Bryobacteraceae bacterium]
MLGKLIPAGLIAAAAWANVINDVRAAVAHDNFALGDSIIQKYRSSEGATPEIIVALSWMGRGALGAKQLDKADAYAKETHRLALEELKKRPLDAEAYLPIALGAAIEVEAQVLNARGERSAAVTYLRAELAKYQATSIRTRIQKNINLLSLEGKAAPPLDEHEFLGAKPATLASLKGKPVVLFFWAHWCGDCKQEAPILAEIAKEYAAKGLTVVAPTQHYGYVARGEEAGPADETKYIDEVRHKFYSDLLDVPTPISEENFKKYGASTTPTVVLIDRQGIVRLYHPGTMSLEELRAALNRLG